MRREHDLEKLALDLIGGGNWLSEKDHAQQESFKNPRPQSLRRATLSTT